MKKLTFWFSSDTNTSHFKDECDRLMVTVTERQLPLLECVDVDDSIAHEIIAKAKELGAEITEEY